MATKDGELRTSIKIRISTRDDLAKIGVMTESYDDVISRLIMLYNGKKIGNKGKDPKYLKVM